MCGRIRQAREIVDYNENFHWPITSILDEGLKYNVPPGTRPIVMHDLGLDHYARLFWGYRPPWYQRPPVSNARLDTVLKRSPFWKPLLAQRIIVPVDGWFEWTGEKGNKQPWYISPQDGKPIYLAGITAWLPGKDVLAETGFAVITDDAAGGMVDIHDRRPIALRPEDAMMWVSRQTSIEEALELLSTPRPESAFQWWEVTREMGNSRYQLRDTAAPISFTD